MPSTIEQIIKKHGDVVITYKAGEVEKVLVTDSKVVKEGSTWGKVYHLVYRPIEGGFYAAQEHTDTYVCG